MMDALGISDIGDVIRGKTTLSDRALTRSYYSNRAPLCGESNSERLQNLSNINSRGSFRQNSSKMNNSDEIRVKHNYLDNDIHVPSLEEYRYQKITYKEDFNLNINVNYLSSEERKKAYLGEEDNIICGRFPHLNYCNCKIPCSLILPYIHSIEILPNLYVGSIECIYKTKELLFNKIKYILNCSCIEFHKRLKFFEYYDIYINDSDSENAIKFFKITNRIIEDNLNKNNKIIIVSENGISRNFTLIMAYLIGRKEMKYSEAYDFIKKKFKYAEPNEGFKTQLKHYDLSVNV